MPHETPIIPWTRFWCPIDKGISCGDSGRDFLSDPESDFGRILNPNVLNIDTLLEQPCLVLCGEPGMGKSKALELAKSKIISRTGADQTPIWLNFREIPNVEIFHRKTFETAKWKGWLASDSRLTLVVDGIDEGLMKVPDFIPHLAAELREVPVQRLQLILVCRTTEWSLAAGGQLTKLWGKSEAETVFELCPLRQQDARVAAQEWKVDADAFMSAVHEQQVVGLAARPCTLFFLLRAFKENGSFPGTHFDLYDTGCKRLCEEHDWERTAAFRFHQPQPNRYTAVEVHGMAARIAVLLMVSGKSAVKVRPGEDAEPTDLLLEQIAAVSSERDLVLATLSSALFSARGTDRFGFAHQTFAECLAANALQKLPLIQVKSLLCQRDGPVTHVVPQLAETAAWLAAMRADFLEFLIAHEPEVLLRSDVTRIQDKHKDQLVTSLLERTKNEEAFDERELRRFFAGLKHPGLAQQLWKYISDRSLNWVTRRMAIEIAGHCKLAELMTDFLSLLCSESDGTLRDYLANSLEALTPASRAQELIPLAKGEVGPDGDDTIKGCALMVLVPNVWSVGAAMPYINLPRNDHFFGTYHALLQYHLPKHVQVTDLPALLPKLAEWDDCFDSLSFFNQLADKAMVVALQSLDDPLICELTVEVWRQKSRLHQRLGNGSESQFQTVLTNDTRLRHRFVEAILSSPGTTIEDARRCGFSESKLMVDSDLRWALEQIEIAIPNRRPVWAEIIRALANPEATKDCWDLFLSQVEAVPELKQRFTWLRAYDLDEPEARKAKADWLRVERIRTRWQRKLPAPPDRELRIRDALTQIQQGNTRWWVTLCQDLRLKEDGSYSSAGKHDITAFESWKTANGERQDLIREAARRFLIEHDDGYSTKGSRTNYSDPGYMAIGLLRDQLPNDSELKSAVVKNWIDAITGYFNHGDEQQQQLVALVYKIAPERCIEGLLREVRDDDKRHGQVFALRSYRLCWDARLTETLLRLIRSGELKPGSVESAFSFLAEVDPTAAVECVKWLLPQGIEFDQTVQERTITVLTIALGKIPNRIWDVAWPLIASQRSLAEPVLARISHGIEDQSKKTFFPVLTENQLGDTYLLLNEIFPQAEDPPHTDGEVSPRRAVVQFKGELIGVLTSRGTDAACQQLTRLSVALPSQRLWLRWRCTEAQRLKRRKSWQPASPDVVNKLLNSPKARVIENEGDILEVVLESLQRFQSYLTKHAPPAAGNLWNYTGAGNQREKFRPKDEEDLSDSIAIWLREDLGLAAGVVVGREVQPRRGQKTDITVVALGTTPNPKTNSAVTVVIEVKGCWHPKVKSAIETQLVGDYLEKNGLTHGIYLVGWYVCDRWDGSWSGAKSNLSSANYEDACKEVAALAAPYDGVKNSTVVEAVCLDCRFPS